MNLRFLLGVLAYAVPFAILFLAADRDFASGEAKMSLIVALVAFLGIRWVRHHMASSVQFEPATSATEMKPANSLRSKTAFKGLLSGPWTLVALCMAFGFGPILIAHRMGILASSTAEISAVPFQIWPVLLISSSLMWSQLPNARASRRISWWIAMLLLLFLGTLTVLLVPGMLSALSKGRNFETAWQFGALLSAIPIAAFAWRIYKDRASERDTAK